MKFIDIPSRILLKCLTIFAIIHPCDLLAKSSFQRNSRAEIISRAPKNSLRGSNRNRTRSKLSSTKNDSHFSTEPRWELRIAPVALLARWLIVDASYRISDHWATGPIGALYYSEGQGHMFGISRHGYSVGWGGSYYFTSVYSNTFYLSARTFYDSYFAYPHAFLGPNEIQGFRANSTIGYQWRASRMTVLAGLGGEYADHTITRRAQGEDPSNMTDSSWLPYLEFKIGLEI